MTGDDVRVDLQQRLWRARRRHDHFDAVLRPTSLGWTLQYFFNDRPVVTWAYPDETQARADASGRLRALQRAGWTVHW